MLTCKFARRNSCHLSILCIRSGGAEVLYQSGVSSIVHRTHSTTLISLILLLMCVPFGHKWPAICKKKSIVYRSVCLVLIERYQDSSLNAGTASTSKRFLQFLLYYYITRDLPGVALVITFFTTLFTKKEIEFLDKCAFLQILQHDCKNIATMV